jgi:hypothetical protein
VNVALADDTAQKLLADLVFAEVRRCVNLADVCMFEHDLEELLRDAIADDDGAPPAILASSLIDRAWARVADDMRVLREDRRACWCEPAAEASP